MNPQKMFYITQIIYINGGQEDVFDQFEAVAIPMISKHSGRLLFRLRPPESSFVEIHMERPYEVHLVEFDTEEDFEKFMQDPERKRFVHLKEKSVRTAWMVGGKKV